MKRLLVILSLAALTAVFGIGKIAPSSEAAITQLFIDVKCSTHFPGTATASISWTGNHPGALGQFLDMSRANNGWLPDTFSAAGPMHASRTSFVWDNLPAGMYLYARHNQYFANGAWDPSATYWLLTPECSNVSQVSPATAPAPQQQATASQQPQIIAQNPLPQQPQMAPQPNPITGGCISFTYQKARDWCGSRVGDLLNCDDFSGSEEATRFTKTVDPLDINRLDQNRNGVSCEMT
jgi:hypothetical protein